MTQDPLHASIRDDLVAGVVAISGRLRTYSELVLANILWGCLYPAGKPVLAEVTPLDIALVRAVVAFFVLAGLMLVSGRRAVLVEELRQRPLAGLVQGLLSFSFSSLLAMMALGYLSASVMGLVSNASPLWLALGTLVLFRPADSWRLLAGAVIAFAGMGLVLFQDADALVAVGVHGPNLVGVGIALLTSIVIAVSTVWGRYTMRTSDPLACTTLACAWGSIPLLYLAQRTGDVGLILSASLPAKGLLLFLGVGCTAVNFALWFDALKRLPAARASTFQYLVPLVTAVLAAIFLGEPITLALAIGGALTIGGIALAQERAPAESRKLASSEG